MKKFVSTLLALFLVVPVFAQRNALFRPVQRDTQSVQRDTQSGSEYNSYFRISAGFSGLSFSPDIDQTKFDADIFASGGAIGFALGHKLVGGQKGGLYAEIGAELAYNSGSHTNNAGKKTETETRLNILSTTIPIDLCLKAAIGDRPDYFVLFFGLSPKVNLSADMNYQTTSEKVDGVLIVNGHNVGTSTKTVVNDHKVDLFNEEDMGKDFTAKRFQLGVNAGIGVELGKMLFSYRFCYDFMPFQAYKYNKADVNINTMSHLVSISYVLRK